MCVCGLRHSSPDGGSSEHGILLRVFATVRVESDKSDKSDGSDKSDKSDRSDKSDKSDRSDRSDRSAARTEPNPST